MDSVLQQEALHYVQTRHAYKRVLGCIITKYKSLGKLGGYMILKELTEEECQLLAPIDYQVMATRQCRIKIEKFMNHFCSGKFQEVDFLELLKAYAGEDIVSNKQKREQHLQELASWFETLKQAVSQQVLKEWLDAIQDTKDQGYKLLLQGYQKDEKTCSCVIKMIDEALKVLEEEKEVAIPLALLASTVTKDAHFFDMQRTEGKLLLYVLAYQAKVTYPNQLEELNALLQTVGIIRGEVSNYTLCYGIHGRAKELTKPWEEFWHLGEPLNLSIYNVKDCTHIWTTFEKVYIVENPTVFLQLLERAKETATALLCVNGQINTCTYTILDKLCESGTIFYYNGDFDPEGLLIADRLKRRYREHLHLWHYEIQDYDLVKGKVSIETRLKQLEQLKTPQLQKIGEALKKHGVAGYQELLVERLIEDINAREMK
ncbi:MAG: TIGR02679 domain-containing protein [Cellulosilyticaceae bacterium]